MQQPNVKMFFPQLLNKVGQTWNGGTDFKRGPGTTAPLLMAPCVFCSCVWDFHSRGKRVATWSTRCSLASLCRQTHVQRVCFFEHRQGPNEVRWRPGKEANLAPSCFKQVFWKQMNFIEVSTLWHCWDFSAPTVAFLRPCSDSTP